MKRVLNVETINYIGGKIKVCGWVNTVRSHGKILFIDLRDKSGILQVVFVPDEEKIYNAKSDISGETCYNLAKELRPEWVVEIIGEVVKRPPPND